MNKKSILMLFITMVLILSVGVVSGCQSQHSGVIDSVKENNSTVAFSTWAWDATQITNDDFLTDLKYLGINRVFLNSGWEPYAGLHYLEHNPSKYRDFIGNANKEGITVEALFGNNYWSYVQYRNHMMNELDLVFNYNKENPNSRFNALHLDIEPQALQGFSRNQDNILQEFVSNIEEVRNVVDAHNSSNNDNIKLVLDLPTWFVDIEYHGKNLLDDLLPLIDEVSLMNYTQDTDTFIHNGKAFLQKAEEYNVKVNVGLEFQSSFENINVSDFTMEQLENLLSEANTVFKEFDNFTGFSMHRVNDFKEFVERNK